MKVAQFILLAFVFLTGCQTTERELRFVGTWKMADGAYFLRLYPDGRAAIWPSPPDGRTGWTQFKNGTLFLGYRPPLRDPSLSIRGSSLIMHTNVADRVFHSVPDITPP
jgi:hypothetical protein